MLLSSPVPVFALRPLLFLKEFPQFPAHWCHFWCSHSRFIPKAPAWKLCSGIACDTFSRRGTRGAGDQHHGQLQTAYKRQLLLQGTGQSLIQREELEPPAAYTCRAIASCFIPLIHSRCVESFAMKAQPLEVSQ